MAAKVFPEIPRGVLARLLDMCGTPGPMSPRHLMGEPLPLSPLQIAELYGAEYLTRAAASPEALSPTFARAAQVLLNPTTNLTFRIWGADALCAETNILFPGDIVAGGGVALPPVDQHYRMAAFVEPDDIVADLRPVLPPKRDDESKRFDFDAHLDVGVAAVLFALVDLERAREDGNGAAGFSEPEISGYLNGRWGFTGFDTLLSYVTAAGMRSRPPGVAEVEYGLGVLKDAGSVESVAPERYTLSKALRPLVALTRTLSSGLQWQRVTLLESGDTLLVNRIYIYGDHGLTLCLAPTVKSRMLVASVLRREVSSFVADEISGVAGASSRVAAASQ
jgi:hypothetical protein